MEVHKLNLSREDSNQPWSPDLHIFTLYVGESYFSTSNLTKLTRDNGLFEGCIIPMVVALVCKNFVWVYYVVCTKTCSILSRPTTWSPWRRAWYCLDLLRGLHGGMLDI